MRPTDTQKLKMLTTWSPYRSLIVSIDGNGWQIAHVSYGSLSVHGHGPSFEETLENAYQRLKRIWLKCAARKY